ncbi:capsular polysaccharide synthesis protein [Pseudoclavibacter caeni]|jgi:hypothetical protein|uniref:Capsular biosynthesis protein n=1 Tax=Pseudoclavibacter caeni TaxID=908846 RepID=A0A7C8BN33_9MICO|nr:capsular polysaccharide synthesis protein [Pseudoclavibacter caeni]KAB1631726.1 hypothetical protein F8O02_07235 [Pseudoclavibacter caeni]NYJ97357.1 hypothetical protein [Pseudoclavibacter caeni]
MLEPDPQPAPPGPLRIQLDRVRERFAPTVSARAALTAHREVQLFLSDRHDLVLATAGLGEDDILRTGLPDAAQARAAASAAPAGPVFSYWSAPDGHVPPLVRACLDRLRALHPDAVVLTPASVPDWVTLPGAVVDRLRERPAHYADFLRLSLLERHGGVWVDATCLLLRSIDEGLAEAGPQPGPSLLMPRWTDREISNWFIAATPGHPLVRLLRAALELWWTEIGTLPDYFLFHRMFAGLLAEYPQAGLLWAGTPWLGSAPAHLLQMVMFRPYDSDLVAAASRLSFAQKLSHKFDADTVPPDSLLARLLAGRLFEG